MTPTRHQIAELPKLAACAVLEEGDEFVPTMELLEAAYNKLNANDALQRARRILEFDAL